MTDWRVSVRKCPGYEPEQVRARLWELLGCLGEPGTLLTAGKKILLKPNVLGGWSPERGITTHPEIVRQLAKMLTAAGCIVVVGDSSGGRAEARRTMAALQQSGIWDAAQAGGAGVVNFDAGGSEPRTVDGRTYHIASEVLAADVIVSLPKLKTHALTVLTGAVKNMYGCIPGLNKVRLHRLHPEPAEFSSVVVDVCQAVQPDITIMDAVVAMEGNGPSLGSLVQPGLLLAGTNPFAVDVAAAALVGVPAGRVHTIGIGAARGAGPGSIDEVALDDEGVDPTEVRPFRLPATVDLPLSRLQPILSFFWRQLELAPVVDRRKCSGCRFCLTSCPVGAISMAGRVPGFDRTTCINCMCCCEVCPELALDIRATSLIGSLLQRIVGIMRRLEARGG